jgi:hypothetical protein
VESGTNSETIKGNNTLTVLDGARTVDVTGGDYSATSSEADVAREDVHYPATVETLALIETKPTGKKERYCSYDHDPNGCTTCVISAGSASSGARCAPWGRSNGLHTATTLTRCMSEHYPRCGPKRPGSSSIPSVRPGGSVVRVALSLSAGGLGSDAMMYTCLRARICCDNNSGSH